MAAIVKYKRINIGENQGENGVVDSEHNVSIQNVTTDHAQLVIENETGDFIINDKQCCSCHKRCLGDCKNCIKRSWIAVLFGLLIFAAAFIISFVIVSVVKEPKQSLYNCEPLIIHVITCLLKHFRSWGSSRCSHLLTDSRNNIRTRRISC